ncbi:NAD(P)-dependent oxidoreductase [Amycolatopsis ruanii]|uniref:NAD(P)-dependent oxidoreductase n=1 Tax=Amycolatopsis ruanii TaxID=944491 RepID=UPI000E270FD3|nr:NAD(P)-binding domain-containing protein [Amycolatopsis ruanii]
MTSTTLIGLGPMGQAMVRVLLDHGTEVTVWNRTKSRADDVVARGAGLAATPAEAVKAAELVILSLTDYQAMYDVLADAGEALAGRVVVNLSSDTPQRTREAAAWLAERGATLVAGGIMVPAPLVGAEASYVFYSGPRDVFEAHEPVLRHIGRPEYLGEDHGLAQLFYQAALTIFLTSLSSYLQAFALLEAEGAEPERLVPFAKEAAGLGATYLDETVAHLRARTYPGDLSTATMMGATADHIVQASRDAGVDLALPEAVKSHYDRAIAAGHGRDNWTSLWEVVAKRR